MLILRETTKEKQKIKSKPLKHFYLKVRKTHWNLPTIMIFFWCNGYWFSLDISTGHTSEMNLDGTELSLTYEVSRILKTTSELNHQFASGYTWFRCTAADLRPRILWSVDGRRPDHGILARWRSRIDLNGVRGWTISRVLFADVIRTHRSPVRY